MFLLIFILFDVFSEINADKITVAGRIYCNSSYVTGDAYIELNDFDGILEPDFIGETIVHLENEPNKRKVFRISGEATDGSLNPRLEPYLRIFHGCGVHFRTECLQLIPEEAPSEDYFYYMGDIVLNGNEEIKAWESCQPKYCRPMTKWQVCYDVQWVKIKNFKKKRKNSAEKRTRSEGNDLKDKAVE